MLGLPSGASPLGAREISSERLEGYRLTRVEFISEPGVYISRQIVPSEPPNGECVVYTTGDVTDLRSGSGR